MLTKLLSSAYRGPVIREIMRQIFPNQWHRVVSNSVWKGAGSWEGVSGPAENFGSYAFLMFDVNKRTYSIIRLATYVMLNNIHGLGTRYDPIQIPIMSEQMGATASPIFIQYKRERLVLS